MLGVLFFNLVASSTAYKCQESKHRGIKHKACGPESTRNTLQLDGFGKCEGMHRLSTLNCIKISFTAFPVEEPPLPQPFIPHQSN